MRDCIEQARRNRPAGGRPAPQPIPGRRQRAQPGDRRDCRCRRSRCRAGCSGSQGARLVPVVKMAAAPLHLARSCQRHVDAVDRIRQADPAEVPRRNDRQQVDADVGRATCGRDHRMRHLLEIVRRQHVVLGRDERLEIEPGPARDRAQPRPVGVVDHPAGPRSRPNG